MKPTMFIVILGLLIFSTRPVSPQDTEGPALEQCRIDLASWTHDFSYVQPANADLMLTSRQLMDRTRELKKCILLEAKEPYRSSITSLEPHYDELLEERLLGFLARHNLLEQFQKEDSDGLR
jgi:hypothetical protein